LSTVQRLFPQLGGGGSSGSLQSGSSAASLNPLGLWSPASKPSLGQLRAAGPSFSKSSNGSFSKLSHPVLLRAGSGGGSNGSLKPSNGSFTKMSIPTLLRAGSGGGSSNGSLSRPAAASPFQPPRPPPSAPHGSGHAVGLAIPAGLGPRGASTSGSAAYAAAGLGLWEPHSAGRGHGGGGGGLGGAHHLADHSSAALHVVGSGQGHLAAATPTTLPLSMLSKAICPGLFVALLPNRTLVMEVPVGDEAKGAQRRDDGGKLLRTNQRGRPSERPMERIGGKGV
jgi:hypothetical protein